MSASRNRKNPDADGLGLTYIGDGSALIGVPARDLDADEAALHDADALLASGLYALTPAPHEDTNDART